MEKSYSEIGERLAKKVSSWNDKLENATDSIGKTTAQRMLDRSMRRVKDLQSAFLTDHNADAMEKLGGQSNGQASGGLPTAAKGMPNPFGPDNIQTGAFGVSALLSLLDNGKNKQTIASMQAPAKPLMFSSPRMDTTVDISGQEGQLRDSIAGFRDNARRTHGSAGSRTAAGLKALDAQARGLNQMYSAKANQEAGMRNQQALIDKRTNTQNVMTQNAYAQSVVDFNNNKQAAFSQNYSNSINDLMLMTKDFNLQRQDKKRFNTMIPLWDKDGVYSAFYK